MKYTREKRKTKTKKIIGILFLILILLTVFIGRKYYKNSIDSMDLNNPENVEIIIPQATSSTRIAEILYEKGLINNKLIFKYKLKRKDLGNKLKAGEYNLSTGMNLDTIIESLTKGGRSRETVKITIPEGYEIRQIVDKLYKEDIVDADVFMDLVNDKSNFEKEFPFLKKLEIDQNLEGFLFPSTYEIYLETSEEKIVVKMLKEFEDVYEKEIKSKLDELDLSLNEAVILASIVEREGKLDEERPLMSAVFYNRIEEGMMLESCATVQFILGERKEVLSNKDTSTPSPYNTYIHQGLPPTPIASPGKDSIIAAVNPADVDYLYFVLTGKDGSHTFTKTYEEHLNAKTNN